MLNRHLIWQNRPILKEFSCLSNLAVSVISLWIQTPSPPPLPHVMPLGDPESPRKVPMAGEAFEPFVVCRKFWPLIGRWWLKSFLPSLWVQKEFYLLCPGGHGTYFNADWSSRCEDVFSFCFGATSRVWGTHPIRLLGNFLSHMLSTAQSLSYKQKDAL